MSERNHNSLQPNSPAGFSVVELLTAMALSLLMFALTFTLVQQLYNTADVVGSMADVNENVRAAVDMIARDLSTAGQNVPVGGIPLPYGGTGTTMIKEPYPSNTNFPTPLSGSALYMPVLIAGNGLGNSQGSGSTAISNDIVTIVGVNQTSLFNPTTVNSTTSPPTFTSASATITVSTTAAGYVSPGQLIMLSNINSNCLLAISSVNTSTGAITFTNGDTTHDLMGVNQFPTVSSSTGAITAGPTSGTILQLETATTNAGKTTYAWPTGLTAYPISLVTYYLDTSTPEKNLTKLTSMGTNGCATVTCTNVVALGIDVIQIFYNLYPPATLNGATSDPTENPWPTTTDTGNSPNHIRKVVITLIGETNHQNFANQQWYSKEIKTAVTIQNLDFANQYGTASSSTQMTQN